METARSYILSWFDERLKNLDMNESLKDSKTRLQEFLQSRRLPLPTYDLIKVEGEAHAQTFYIECQVQGVDKAPKGTGSSRRQAEQEAAKSALIALQVEK